jgi:hypothetical protein
MYNFCVIYTIQFKKADSGKKYLTLSGSVYWAMWRDKKGGDKISRDVSNDPSRRYLSNNTTTPGGVDASRYLYDPPPPPHVGGAAAAPESTANKVEQQRRGGRYLGTDKNSPPTRAPYDVEDFFKNWPMSFIYSTTAAESRTEHKHYCPWAHYTLMDLRVPIRKYY